MVAPFYRRIARIRAGAASDSSGVRPSNDSTNSSSGVVTIDSGNVFASISGGR
jgi:hypothetical protein